MNYKRGKNVNVHTFFRFLIVSCLLYAICQNKSPGKPRVSVGRGIDTERENYCDFLKTLSHRGRAGRKGAHEYMGTYLMLGNVPGSLEKLSEVGYRLKVLLSE